MTGPCLVLVSQKPEQSHANLNGDRKHRQLEAMGTATGNLTKPALEADISASTPLANMIR
jgi:hypothetical protein